jgi:hypothetical protein
MSEAFGGLVMVGERGPEIFVIGERPCEYMVARSVGERIATAAREWIGTPFHWEASVKGVGVDCRGRLLAPH